MNTTIKKYYATVAPVLLRGKERLRYLQKYQGVISQARAKKILHATTKTRKSLDRS